MSRQCSLTEFKHNDSFQGQVYKHLLIKKYFHLGTKEWLILLWDDKEQNNFMNE